MVTSFDITKSITVYNVCFLSVSGIISTVICVLNLLHWNWICQHISLDKIKDVGQA